MRNTLFKLIAVLAIVLFVLFAAVFYYTEQAKESYDESCRFSKIELYGQNTQPFNIRSAIPADSTTDFVAQFPGEKYLASSNWHTIQSILRDLKTLDSNGVDPFNSASAISEALTTKNSQWESNNLDTLYQILIWAEPMFLYSKTGEQHAILFQAVSEYWIGHVSNTLQQVIDDDPYAYINCKFKYLRARTCELAGACGDRTPNTVKVINNLTEQKWSYLLTRFWTHTGFLFKSVIFVGIVLTIAAYYSLLKNLIRKKQ